MPVPRYAWAILILLVACTASGAQLALKVKAPANCAGSFSYSVELTNAQHEGIGAQWVAVTVDGEPLERLKTDQNGRFSSSGEMKPEWCNKDVIITATAENAKVSTQETLSVAACEDGTAVDACSAKKGYVCQADATLTFNCEKCGCEQGLLCSGNACLSSETKSANLITELQKHIVKVNHTWASGSGVVLSYDDVADITRILTNNHVVADGTSISDINVFASSSGSSVKQIYVAPQGIDLAVIEVAGKIGTPIGTTFVTSEKGQTVYALGSPLGFEGSVSKGIISNFVKDEWNSNYTLDHIQTDAAVNPGNSGGGLFLERDGNLVGINTYTFTETEGLNFAIDVREMNLLPPYQQWPKWTPVQTCRDGTPYGYCSDDMPLACDNGELIQGCQYCGCPDEFPVCYTDGKCRRD